jgi:hypothetical protein
MAYTLTQLLTRTRDMLDEATASRWSDTQLRRWVNNCLDDIARETLAVKGDTSVTSVAGTAEYTVPTSVLQIEAAYWTDASSNLIPLTPVQWENADTVWGMWQNQQSSQPSVYSVWGYSPNLKIRLYPVPNVSSRTVVLKVAKLPTHVDESGAGDASTIDFPEGWVDAIVDYVEFNALRRDRDPRWQEAQSLYLAKRQSLAEHDYMNTAREFVYDPAVAGGLPRWLVDPRY